MRSTSLTTPRLTRRPLFWVLALSLATAMGITGGAPAAGEPSLPVPGSLTRGVYTVGAVDPAGESIVAQLADTVGSDSNMYWAGTPGSRVWLVRPGPDPYNDPFYASSFTYARPDCPVEEPGQLWTATKDPNIADQDCWSVMAFGGGGSGPLGVQAALTATGNGGEPLVFDHWQSTQLSTGPCRTGAGLKLRGYHTNFPGGATLQTWYDHTKPFADQRFTAVAHYAPLKPDTTAPLVGIESPTGCGAATDFDGVVTNYSQGSVVLAEYACHDPGFGAPETCEGTVPNGSPIDTSTPGVKTFTVTGTDADGNTSSRTTEYTVDGPVDTTKPTVSAAATTEPNAAGWYSGSVAVHFTCTDEAGGSGIPAGACPDDEVLPVSGSSTARTVTDAAGNLSDPSNTVDVLIDTTNPTIAPAPIPAANSAGWYDSPVVVGFICDDNESGVAECTDSTTISEGADQAVTGTATDVAGNVASATVSDLNIDQTAPGIQWSGGPVTGGQYLMADVPEAPTCTATDDLSGPDSCEISGYSKNPGTHTVVATATDQAGNSTLASRTYKVTAYTLAGFHRPVNMGDVWNTVKAGSTVPFKFEVFDGDTELTSTSIVTGFDAKGATCPGADAATDDIEFTAAGGSSLTYDTIAGAYAQNWKTPKGAGMCYLVTLKTRDGSTLSAHFSLK